MSLKNIDLSALTKPTSPSIKAMVGNRYGRLIIIAYLGNFIRDKSAYTHVLKAVCDCGNVDVYRAASIKVGHTTSCGCYSREVTGSLNRKHGHASYNRSKAYNSWAAMKRRCYDKNNNYYKIYGGRGIRVCDRWLNSFENFLEDMGEPPTKTHTLDRYPDGNGNYDPLNCRWATPKEQGQNTSKVVNHIYNGQKLCLSELERIGNVSIRTIKHRIKNLGWSVDDAVNMPPLKGKQTYNRNYKDIMKTNEVNNTIGTILESI